MILLLWRIATKLIPFLGLFGFGDLVAFGNIFTYRPGALRVNVIRLGDNCSKISE